MGASKGGFRGSSKYFLKERGTGYVNGRLEDDSNFIVARHDPEMVSKGTGYQVNNLYRVPVLSSKSDWLMRSKSEIFDSIPQAGYVNLFIVITL